MGKITAFMMFESSTNIQRGDGKGVAQQLIGPLMAIRPIAIPSSYSFSVSFGLSGVDFSSSNSIRMQILAPDGTVIQDTPDTPLPSLVPKDTMPDDYQGFIMTADLRNLEFRVEGVYIIKLFFNGEEVYAHDIPVFKRAELAEEK